jgi:WD40-like Beta Propeller Repeat
MNANVLEVDIQPVGGPVSPIRRRLRRAAAGLALVIIVVLVLVATNALPPAAPRPAHPNRIAVVDETGGLFTVAPDGSDRRSLGAADVQYQFPAWSPDGTRIAAIGGDGSEGGVYVFDDAASRAGAASATDAPVTLYPPSSAYPIYVYWSPNGSRLSFITSGTVDIALRIAPADGSAPANPIVHGQPMYWDWIDDSHLLVHSGGSAQGAFVGEVGLDATRTNEISDAPGSFQAPGVSTDGRERAFVAVTADGAVAVVAEDRTGHASVQAPVDGASTLGWGPGGTLLAFTAPQQDNGVPLGALETLDARTGDTQTLLSGLVVAYFWAPDGRRIAAIRVVVANDQTASLTPPRSAVATALELDVVDASNGDIELTRTIQLPNLLLGQFLPFFDQYALSHRIWSPAGDALVLPLVDDVGSSHVTVIPVDGSPPIAIADGVAAFWSP